MEITMKRLALLALGGLGLAATGCSPSATDGQPATADTAAATPTEDATAFIARTNKELQDLSVESARLSWVKATYITPDTEALEAESTRKLLAYNSDMVKQARTYDGGASDADTARALMLIRTGTSMPAPDDADKQAQLAEISTRMASTYGKGKYCKDDGQTCQTLGDLTSIMAESRNYDDLLDAWTGWRTISPPMREDYQRFAALVNEGAADLGYSDAGALWRARYDMSPEAFEAEAERLWQQVKPLYDELHCYARARLGDVYGVDKVPQDQPIPAHLLGNMWSQTWENIYDLLEPYEGVSNLDVTASLENQDYDVRGMFDQAEGFFTSLGMPELPETFYERSMLTRPRDRDVQCHPSAWPIDNDTDVRIKMCTEVNEVDLKTIYHELGHIYYFLAYNDQPLLFQGGAHDGFHEAIGDTIVLSMTPDYLREVGLVESSTPTAADDRAIINQQMKMALEKIAFLPFGKLVDQWRWDVFAGKISPSEYNAGWWKLRTEYQGIAPPVERSESDFDPGAKYHIPANTPYTRYFLSFILQFQFHKALCESAGYEGPLHACSIFGSKEAGERFWAMLGKGQSQPWADALEELTGTREMDASAIIDYFAPLMGWLRERNQGTSCGW